jgi:hypothetical protein
MASRIQVRCARVPAVHRRENGVRSRLDAEMDVAAEELVLGDDPDDLVRKVLGMARQEADPADPAPPPGAEMIGDEAKQGRKIDIPRLALPSVGIDVLS